MSASYCLADWIIEQTADVLIYTDTAGTIVRWNGAATLLLGHNSVEAIGQSIDLIIPEHLRPAHWRGFRAAMTGGSAKLAGRPTVTRAVHKNGSKVYLEMTFALVRDQAGTILGSVAMARDVTARIERERESR